MAVHQQRLVHERLVRARNAGASARTATGRLTYLTYRFARYDTKPRAQPAKAAAADRDGVAVGEFDDAVIAGALQAHDAVDIDDVTAMHPDEAAPVEPRLHVADRQRAEKFGAAVKYISVVGIGMDGDHILHRNEMGGAVALDRQAARALRAGIGADMARSEGWCGARRRLSLDAARR